MIDYRRSTLWGQVRCWVMLLLLLLLPGLLTAAPAFRFILLSDTHIGSNNAKEDLLASVREINSMTNLSFVLLSGDVTEYGSREQFRQAKEILDGLKIPLHILPGNHDTKWSESGATDFARFWGQDRFVFEYEGFRFIALHQGPIMKMGDGYWAPQDVRWLETTLKSMPDTNQPIVFVTHYPVDDSIANWYAVLDLLKRYNTQAILCGHGHANHAFTFEGVPGTMGRSNLRASEKLGGFNVVEVKDGQMTFSVCRPSEPVRAPWRTIVLAKHDYASDTNHYPRPDFSVNARYPQVRERWTVETGFTIAGTPALWKDLAIIGDASGTIQALSVKTGQTQWKFKAQNAVYATPEVSGKRVVVPSTDGNIYALDAATGKELWRYKTDRPILASPRVAKGVVFLGSSEGKFRALDLASGKLRWEFDGLAGFVETKPLVYDGKVIFGAWDEHLYALNAKSGELAWKWNGTRPGTLLSPAACWPVAAHKKIFIVAPDNRMTAIDPETGKTLWRTNTSTYKVRESIGLSEDQKRIYVRCMDKFIFAYATKPNIPTQVWGIDAQFGYDINSAMLVEKNGVLFYGTKNDVLLAMDPKTGAIQWQHKIGAGVMNTVLPLSASRVLATDFEGKIVMLEAGK